MSHKTVSVTIEFPQDVLELIDNVSRGQLQTRSGFIRGAVVKELRQQCPQLLDRVLQPRVVRDVLNDIARGKIAP